MRISIAAVPTMLVYIYIYVYVCVCVNNLICIGTTIKVDQVNYSMVSVKWIIWYFKKNARNKMSKTKIQYKDMTYLGMLLFLIKK